MQPSNGLGDSLAVILTQHKLLYDVINPYLMSIKGCYSAESMVQATKTMVQEVVKLVIPGETVSFNAEP